MANWRVCDVVSCRYIRDGLVASTALAFGDSSSAVTNFFGPHAVLRAMPPVATETLKSIVGDW